MACFVLLVGACGGSSDSDEKQITSLVHSFFNESIKGDAAKAYEMIDAESKADCSKKEFTDDTEAAQSFFKSIGTKIEVSRVYDIKVSGDSATAKVDVKIDGEKAPGQGTDLPTPSLARASGPRGWSAGAPQPPPRRSGQLAFQPSWPPPSSLPRRSPPGDGSGRRRHRSSASAVEPSSPSTAGAGSRPSPPTADSWRISTGNASAGTGTPAPSPCWSRRRAGRDPSRS
jgi:hypothetical protein